VHTKVQAHSLSGSMASRGLFGSPTASEADSRSRTSDVGSSSMGSSVHGSDAGRGGPPLQNNSGGAGGSNNKAGSSLSATSAKKVLKEVSTWAKGTRTFHHIQDQLRSAASPFSSPASSLSRSALSYPDCPVPANTPSRQDNLASMSSFSDPLPFDHSASLFLLNSRSGTRTRAHMPCMYARGFT
jgi:hypothetical protein